MGAETRLLRDERLAQEAKRRDAAMAKDLEGKRRASERLDVIRSYPKAIKRTREQTSMLESVLALRGLDPLKPPTVAEQEEEERLEAGHWAEMERRDKADRARVGKRDSRSREYEREYGDDA